VQLNNHKAREAIQEKAKFALILTRSEFGCHFRIYVKQTVSLLVTLKTAVTDKLTGGLYQMTKISITCL
jgi:hypothetical protein